MDFKLGSNEDPLTRLLITYISKTWMSKCPWMSKTWIQNINEYKSKTTNPKHDFVLYDWYAFPFQNFTNKKSDWVKNETDMVMKLWYIHSLVCCQPSSQHQKENVTVDCNFEHASMIIFHLKWKRKLHVNVQFTHPISYLNKLSYEAGNYILYIYFF